MAVSNLDMHALFVLGDLRAKLVKQFQSRFVYITEQTPEGIYIAEIDTETALVVDDNQINRELAGAILVKNGFAVEGATNGAEALEAVLQQDFDVILLDGNMPVMDGLEAARRIRALPTGKGKVPIIGLTGRTEEGDREAGLLAGMNDYLVKPVAPSALREVLEHWVPRAP